jgi:hypothetical protein
LALYRPGRRPSSRARPAIDSAYVLAAAGLLAELDPQAATRLIRESLGDAP